MKQKKTSCGKHIWKPADINHLPLTLTWENKTSDLASTPTVTVTVPGTHGYETDKGLSAAELNIHKVVASQVTMDLG